MCLCVCVCVCVCVWACGHVGVCVCIMCGAPDGGLSWWVVFYISYLYIWFVYNSMIFCGGFLVCVFFVFCHGSLVFFGMAVEVYMLILFGQLCTAQPNDRVPSESSSCIPALVSVLWPRHS